jgi:hypothetical protein
MCCDINQPETLRQLGSFDIVHCYGVLYHLETPERVLRLMGEVCTSFAIVETCVSRARTEIVETADELSDDYTQSATGHACRPSRQWVFATLRRYFPFVYHTRTQPVHPEFPTDWNDLSTALALIRSVFVASKQQLDLPSLSTELLDLQSWPRVTDL